MRDLILTQGNSVLISQDHIKQFMVFTRETNFIYRAEMAEALGNMLCVRNQNEESNEGTLNNYGITKQEFQEFYYDEFVDLLHDSDNLVKIKSLEAAAKLTKKNIEVDPTAEGSYLLEEQLRTEVLPEFLRLMENLGEDEESTLLLSSKFGPIIYMISLRFPDIINEIQVQICKFFQQCCIHKDS